MKIKIKSPVVGEAEAKVIKLHCEIGEAFTAFIMDDDENNLGGRENDRVPDFMPENHYGEFLILDIDLETGQILNWKKPTAESIEAFLS